MEKESSFIAGVEIFTPKIFSDERGSFHESFNLKKFNGLMKKEISFVQDNQSTSKEGVFRGLHFQNPPYAQAKLVRVTKGRALDIVLDIRKDSSTYGSIFTFELSQENSKMLYIPEGMAHGFLALEEETVFAYKCTEYYHPASEGCISIESFNIPELDQFDLTINNKDKEGVPFQHFNTKF